MARLGKVKVWQWAVKCLAKGYACHQGDSVSMQQNAMQHIVCIFFIALRPVFLQHPKKIELEGKRKDQSNPFQCDSNNKILRAIPM